MSSEKLAAQNYSPVPFQGLYEFGHHTLGKTLRAFGFTHSGETRLPSEPQPIALALNHDSNIDSILAGEFSWSVLGAPNHILAKAELFHHPFVSRLLIGLGAYPVVRSMSLAKQPEVRDFVRQRAQAPSVNLQFLQGTRKNHEREQFAWQQIDDGSLAIDIQYGLPIYIGAIVGTQRLLFPHLYIHKVLDVPQQDIKLDELDERGLVRLRKPLIRPLAKEIEPIAQEAIDEALNRRYSVLIHEKRSRKTLRRLLANYELEQMEKKEHKY